MSTWYSPALWTWISPNQVFHISMVKNDDRNSWAGGGIHTTPHGAEPQYGIPDLKTGMHLYGTNTVDSGGAQGDYYQRFQLWLTNMRPFMLAHMQAFLQVIYTHHDDFQQRHQNWNTRRLTLNNWLQIDEAYRTYHQQTAPALAREARRAAEEILRGKKPIGTVIATLDDGEILVLELDGSRCVRRSNSFPAQKSKSGWTDQALQLASGTEDFILFKRTNGSLIIAYAADVEDLRIRVRDIRVARLPEAKIVILEDGSIALTKPDAVLAYAIPRDLNEYMEDGSLYVEEVPESGRAVKVANGSGYAVVGWVDGDETIDLAFDTFQVTLEHVTPSANGVVTIVQESDDRLFIVIGETPNPEAVLTVRPRGGLLRRMLFPDGQWHPVNLNDTNYFKPATKAYIIDDNFRHIVWINIPQGPQGEISNYRTVEFLDSPTANADWVLISADGNYIGFAESGNALESYMMWFESLVKAEGEIWESGEETYLLTQDNELLPINYEYPPPDAILSGNTDKWCRIGEVEFPAAYNPLSDEDAIAVWVYCKLQSAVWAEMLDPFANVYWVGDEMYSFSGTADVPEWPDCITEDGWYYIPDVGPVSLVGDNMIQFITEADSSAEESTDGEGGIDGSSSGEEYNT